LTGAGESVAGIELPTFDVNPSEHCDKQEHISDFASQVGDGAEDKKANKRRRLM
jgi:hypothetical protein